MRRNAVLATDARAESIPLDSLLPAPAPPPPSGAGGIGHWEGGEWVPTSHGSTVDEVAPSARLNWNRCGADASEGPAAKAPPPMPPPSEAPAQTSRPAAPLVPWIPPPPLGPPPPKAPPPISKARLPTPGSTVAGAAPPLQPEGVVAFGAPRAEDFRSDEVLHEMNGHRFTKVT